MQDGELLLALDWQRDALDDHAYDWQLGLHFPWVILPSRALKTSLSQGTEPAGFDFDVGEVSIRSRVGERMINVLFTLIKKICCRTMRMKVKLRLHNSPNQCGFPRHSNALPVPFAHM